MNKKILLLFLIIFSLLGCNKNNNNGVKIWRFAHEEVNGSVQDVYVKEFKKIIEEKSNGKIQIEIYPVGQIGDATQQTELLQLGGLEFAMVSPGNTGTIVPENQLFSLHFLFLEDMEKNKKIFRESVALNEDLTNKYLKKNIMPLSYWAEGFMQWTSNKSLREPKSFRGFKMRTMPSPMTMASYDAYDANPTPIPYMEVYSSLQLNMIDGQENPMFAIEEMKYAEVQNHITLSNASLFVTVTACNPDFFNRLPKEEKNLILDTIDELQDFAFDIQEKLNNEALEKILVTYPETTVETLSSSERQQFINKSKTAKNKYIEMVGKSGAQILTKLENEIDFINNN